MDTVKMEKLQAEKAWRRNHFLPMFIQYLLRFVLVGLFLSSPPWLPIICSSLKFLFFVCLPNLGTIVTWPRFIFIVSNIIIIFLVRESRLSKSCEQPDIYDEYVVRSQSLQRVDSVEVKEKEAIIEEPLVDSVEVKEKEAIIEEPLVEETKEKDEEIKVEEEEEEGGAGEEEMEMECEDLLDEEDEGLPAEELNRRVEDFIAKFNMQRRLEAKMLICCQ